MWQTLILAGVMFIRAGVAEDTERPLEGYVFAGGGAVESTATLHGSVGVEGRLAAGRVGVGAEIGYLAPTRSPTGGVGLLSPAVTVYLRRASMLRPYVSGGYTLFFRTRNLHALHWGAGAEIRLTPGTALRAELRDHVHAGSHVWIVRAGLTFR